MPPPSRPGPPVRRSPRAARPVPARAPAAAQRPLVAVVAAVFGGLVVVELLYLTWLLVDPGAGADAAADAEAAAAGGWPVAALLAVAVWVAAGSVLVLRGRGRGWLVLALGSVPPLLGLLGLTVLFGALGGAAATWGALLLTVGPIGTLVLACQQPVRQWTTRRPAG